MKTYHIGKCSCRNYTLINLLCLRYPYYKQMNKENESISIVTSKGHIAVYRETLA